MRLRNGLLAGIVVAAFPASAAAAPDKTSELSADLPTFEWTGTGTGVLIDTLGLIGDDLGSDSPFACDGAGHDCDYVLLDLKHPGTIKLTAAVDGAETHAIPEYGDLTVPDIDVCFYASDKDGVPQGDSLTAAECATGAGVETCEAKDLKPGFYVAEVSFFLADGATYKANAALTTSVPPSPPAAPAVPEAPAPAPEPAPAPAPAAQNHAPAPPAEPYTADEPKPAAKKPSKKAACQKKVKKIKNKAKRKKAQKRCAKLR